ncbi:MAG: PLDc N-terminal domain-containing protein [Actinomycetota bacterium]|nr:PLDc N-terminal domain-containing protein [Actinomycetota bacterium]
MGVVALWFIGLLVVIIDIAATVDVIRRRDLGGGAKVLWVLLILILPVLGVIAYVIARPSVVDTLEDSEGAKKAASEAEAERARDRARDLGPTNP